MYQLRYFKTVLFLALSLSVGCNQPNKEQKDKLGEIEFSVTGETTAKPSFKKGLLLLHSFEFEDAAEEFRKAINIDKDFAMAYWGEAMTQNHPLWRFQDYEKATGILNELGPTSEARVAKAKTDLEKDFINSINILYGPGTKTERDSSYADCFGKMYKKYPGNNEVTAFYSLALIGSVPVGRNAEIYERAAEMAKEVLSTNPRHPGALHYLIHAYDDPAHAGFAVETADAYSKVAPAAGHALHMPTHIYLALGMWDKVISSNIDSWKAGEERKERKKLSNDALNYHALHWLMYGYLQNGQHGKAKNIVDSMQRYNAALSSSRAREYLIYQKTTYLAETNEYGNRFNEIEVQQDDLNIVTRAMNSFADGMNAYYKKNPTVLSKIILTLAGAILIDEERMVSTGASVCGRVNNPIPNKLDIQQSTVILLELKAMEASLKKDKALADKYFKEAVSIESEISYAYGPPTIVKPSFELYGEWLLDNNKPAEALKQFNHSLIATPGRLRSVKGKEAAEKLISTSAK